MPYFLILTALIALGLFLYWWSEYALHRHRILKVQHRIHVNGIRGKSTVTRIVAGMLREAGLVTIGKSTGTFAAVIDRHGRDVPIERRGPATILEQIEVAREWLTEDVDAWVVECMALRPAYQKASEDQIVRSTIGVLTNVREDHQDVMGETLPEIARSLLSTCPVNGVLITSETDPELLAVIRDVASSRGTEVLVADPGGVSKEEVEAFDYVAFPENIAIAFAIGDLLGIERPTALRGMVRAPEEPGVLRLKEFHVGEKRVTWANLFAVNDRESMIAAMQRLAPMIGADTTKVGILNNRADRERRAIQFADIATRDLEFDRLVTFGAFEQLVTGRLVENGFRRDDILNLGGDSGPGIDQIIDRIILEMPTEHVLLVGFVNIHTHQAEMLLDFIDGVDAGESAQLTAMEPETPNVLVAHA